MNFQDLKYHLESYGCTLDHIEDNLHFATNCINGNCCEIEDLPEYSSVTLCHYCYEVSIPALDGYEDHLERYREMRDNLITIAQDDEPGEDAK